MPDGWRFSSRVTTPVAPIASPVKPRRASSKATRASNTAGFAASALLPESKQFLPLVIDACRTNILPHLRSGGVREPVSRALFPGTQFQPAGVEGALQQRGARAHSGLAAPPQP